MGSIGDVPWRLIAIISLITELGGKRSDEPMEID